MTAARLASPEGWQVSVAVFLVGFGGRGPTVAVGLDSWGWGKVEGWTGMVGGGSSSC